MYYVSGFLCAITDVEAIGIEKPGLGAIGV